MYILNYRAINQNVGDISGRRKQFLGSLKNAVGTPTFCDSKGEYFLNF